MTRYTFITAIMLCCTLTVSAQRKHKVRTAPKTTKTVKAAKNTLPGVSEAQKELFDEMIDNTQKLFVIDSVVVDKATALTAIPQPDDLGKIMAYNTYFNDQVLPGVYIYINGFANKCYYAVNDTLGNSRMMMREKLNNKWGNPQQVKGIGTQYKHINYPFMTSDGETLYFAAKSEEGLGGYDIYVTRFDSDEGTFLEAENVGLPYNSFSDDYLFCIDDIHNFAWFATTRNQPEGKACVYTIKTSNKRVNYQVEAYDEEQLQHLAKLSSISATWPNKQQRNTALAQLNTLRKNGTKNDATNTAIPFFVNDNKTCQSAHDFNTPTAQKLYPQWQVLVKLRTELETALDGLRVQYHNANASSKQTLAQRITTAESNLQQTINDITNIEIQIRKAENNNSK